MIRTVDQVLSEMALLNVQKGTYPDPTPSLDDTILKKTIELNSFINSTDRPYTKLEYLELVDTKKAEISQLKQENETIFNQNVLARASVDTQYESDITAYKSDPVNIRTAKIAVLDDEYTPQFTELATGYMAAVILGDDTAATANRTAYQTLLEEYNTKLALIP